MINLLLPVDRKAVRAIYRHRLFVVGGLLTFGLALIALIIVSSFAFILSLRRGEVLGQIMIAKQQFSADALAKVHQTVSEVNASIKILGPVPGLCHESHAQRPGPGPGFGKLYGRRLGHHFRRFRKDYGFPGSRP